MLSFFHHQKIRTWSVPAIVIVLSASLGMIDSFYLVLQYIQAIASQGEPTPCTVNSIVSCTKTVQGPFAHYFGTPNPLLGMLWYSGFVAYGLVLLCGGVTTKATRAVFGMILSVGLLFSYRLYFASVFQLLGVCPFCLLSTTASTLIGLSFIVDDQRQTDRLIGKRFLPFVYGLQAVSFCTFVCYLPYFIARGVSLLPDPMEAMTHWSMPAIVICVVVMAIGHIAAYRVLSMPKR